jgi:hypothetical protein
VNDEQRERPTVDELAALLRETAQGLSGRELPPFDGEEEWYQAISSGTQTPKWAQDFWKALMLSPTIEICEALLDGESVPMDRLDPEWVRRFGLKARR